MAPQHCLVHWINENLWDVWPVSQIPPEHRYEGALAMLRWQDGQEYLGKVILISASMEKIESEEAKLYKAMKEKEKSVSRKDKRKPKNVQKLGTASENAVRKAVGEKPKLSQAQEIAKKQMAAEKKKQEVNRNKVEKGEDQKLLENSAKKFLDFASSGVDPKTIPKKNSSEVHDVMSDEVNSDSDAVEEMEKDVLANPIASGAIEETTTGKENPGKPNAEVDNEGVNDHQDKNSFFKDFCNPNTEQFLKGLLTVMGFNTVESKLPSKSTPTNSTDGFAKPQTVENQKMVPLKKGFNLLISKGGRNKLLVDSKSQKTPTVFIRKTLTELYGEDQLAQMTALGRKKNKLGIPSNDLNSIYGFVNDHCTDQIAWKEFITCVNKKCSSINKSPGNSKSKIADKSTRSQRVERSPHKNGFSESPLKASPEKDSLESPFKTPTKLTPSKSLRKSSTPKKSFKSPSKPFLVSMIDPAQQLASFSQVPHASHQQQSWLWPSQRQPSSYQQPTYPQLSAATAALHNQQLSNQPCTSQSSSASGQYHSYQQQQEPSYHSQYYQQYPQQSDYPRTWQQGWEGNHPPTLEQL